MAGNSERQKATPGLSAAWKFWRAIEQNQLSSAESSAGVLDQIKALDAGTKELVEDALADLREKEFIAQVVPSAIERGNIPDDNIKLSSRHQALLKEMYVQSSDTDTLNPILKAIQRSISGGDVERALILYSRVPHINDKARILCDLVGSKDQMGLGKIHRVTSHENSATVKLTYKQKTDIVGRFFKVYFRDLQKERGQ